MSNFKYANDIEMFVGKFMDGCQVAFATVAITPDKMLMIGKVKGTDLIIAASTPHIMHEGRLLSQVYFSVFPGEREFVSFRYDLNAEFYYSERDTFNIMQAMREANDFDAAMRMYGVNYHDDDLTDANHLAEFELQVAMLCRDCDVERATPVLPAKKNGVKVEQLDAHNATDLCSDMIINVVEWSIKEMVREEIEAPVLASMEILAMVYNKVPTVEMFIRGLTHKDGLFNDDKNKIDVSELDEQEAIESGMVVLSNYGVNVDFITNDLMNGVREATDQLMEVLPKMEDGEIFLVYATLKFKLARAKETFAEMIHHEAKEVRDNTPMFGSFSLN